MQRLAQSQPTQRMQAVAAARPWLSWRSSRAMWRSFIRRGGDSRGLRGQEDGLGIAVAEGLETYAANRPARASCAPGVARRGCAGPVPALGRRASPRRKA